MNRTVFALPARSDYVTRAGLAITRVAEQFTGGASRLDDLINLLDRRRGVVLSSGTTVPGRYESFDLGFSDPPLKLETVGVNFKLEALNGRGQVLIAFLGDILREPCVVISEKTVSHLSGHIVRGDAPVEEDQRTRRASVMSLVRDIVAAFSANDDGLLGLFGAFAYDLVFQIEDLVQKRAREADQRDIVLYVPDRLLAYDRATKMPLYSRAGIPEAWLFDLVNKRVERHTDPGPAGYRLIAVAHRSESLASTLLPGLTVAVDVLLS